MKKMNKMRITAAALCLLVFSMTSCGTIAESIPVELPQLVVIDDVRIPLGASPDLEPAELRPVIPPYMIKVPSLGMYYISHNGVTLDFSHSYNGYIMVRNENPAQRSVAKISLYGTEYVDIHTLNTYGNWDVLPITRGSGVYLVSVLEGTDDGGYWLNMVFDAAITIELICCRMPFLYPNLYVNFNEYSYAVALAAELVSYATSDLDAVLLIYNFITENIEYNHDFAYAVIQGYITEHIPNIDETLREGGGICFDFAALMAAMLRSQHIPARLEIGYVLELYHAWVSVYMLDTYVLPDEVSNGGWTLFDPTTTAYNIGKGHLPPIIEVYQYIMTSMR